ncbi:hypothetical protein E4T56_gene11305 [Termitomyces sp. T112]|nr:hypothetical protein E4T56_gene11305 [Termitomyces sp. T112]
MLGSKPHQSLLIPHQNSSSAPVIHIASASSTPAILTHGLMPEPHQAHPPSPQLILYSSGPPQTCSDQSPLTILTSPQCLEHLRVPGCQCRESHPPSKNSPSVPEPPWSAEPDNYMETESKQMLLKADKATVPADSMLAAISAKPSHGKDISCTTCKACGCPAHIYAGHTAPWCILEGGGMAGKSVEELRRAWLAFYDNKEKEWEKKSSTALRVTFTPAGGSAFTLEGDPATIVAYLAMQMSRLLSASVGGYAWTLGSGVVSWATQKQQTVAALSCEAEYMAAFEATQECIWLRSLLGALRYASENATTLLCDNNSAINLSEDPMLHQRVKHVDIKYHILRERVASKEIVIQYVNTKDNVADIFTKALAAPQFTRLCAILGIHARRSRPINAHGEEEC